MSTFDSTFDATFTDFLLLVPNPLEQGQALSQSDLDGFYTVSTNNISQDQILSEGNIVLAILIEPDDFEQLQSLGGSGVLAKYSVSPADIAQDQSIDEVTLTILTTGSEIDTITVAIKERYIITTSATTKI